MLANAVVNWTSAVSFRPGSPGGPGLQLAGLAARRRPASPASIQVKIICIAPTVDECLDLRASPEPTRVPGPSLERLDVFQTLAGAVDTCGGSG